MSNQSNQLRSLEYKITPSPDAERLIRQVVASGVPRFIAEPAIIKHDMEFTARVAYS